MSAVETGQMSAVEAGQMSAAAAGQMSAVETRQMYSIQTGLRPVSIVDICRVSTDRCSPQELFGWIQTALAMHLEQLQTQHVEP